MSGLDLHPEELLDALREGTLDATARARLDAHCQHCGPCRLELLLVESAESELAEAERYVQLTAASMLPWGHIDNLVRPKHASRRLRKGASGLVAAIVLTTAFSAAAMVARQGDGWLRDVSDWVMRSAADTRSKKTKAKLRDHALADRPPTHGSEPPITGPSATSGPQRDATDSAQPPSAAGPKHPTLPTRAHSRSAGPASRADQRDAEAALTRATLARTQGESQSAVRLYRLVVERYPRTRAARVALLALARTLCGDLGQPAAALPWLDEYLRHPHYAMAEDALYYRALCLERLERNAEAQRGYHALLARFPDTVYATHALAFLGAASRP